MSLQSYIHAETKYCLAEQVNFKQVSLIQTLRRREDRRIYQYLLLYHSFVHHSCNLYRNVMWYFNAMELHSTLHSVTNYRHCLLIVLSTSSDHHIRGWITLSWRALLIVNNSQKPTYCIMQRSISRYDVQISVFKQPSLYFTPHVSWPSVQPHSMWLRSSARTVV